MDPVKRLLGELELAYEKKVKGKLMIKSKREFCKRNPSMEPLLIMENPYYLDGISRVVRRVRTREEIEMFN
jgi:hypothetical protein